MRTKETSLEKETKRKNLKDFQMNRSNPFAKMLLQSLGENKYLTHRNVVGKNNDEKSVLMAVDENNNPLGQTVFMRTKMVDSETFAKVYKIGFSAFADLKPSVMKVFQYIICQLVPNRDNFNLYVEDIIEETGIHKATIYRALGDLCERQIIARGRNEYEYYINPLYVFNGNRVTFITNWININEPKYTTTERGLSNTIQIMTTDGYLEKPKQLSLDFDYNDVASPFPNIEEKIVDTSKNK